jgi:hypothetical protein
MSRVVSSIVFVLLVAGPAGAQSTANGSIHGVASDQNHDVLPGVAITATSTTVPGHFTATTDRAGQYLLANVPPGDYTIVAELSGFTRLVRTPVTVRAGLNVEADFAMQVGRVEETVEVHEQTPLLETRNGAQAVNISGALLRGIPLSEGREWFGALSLVPGVNTADFSTSKLIFVGGADQSANVIQMDGADVGTSANFGVTYLSLSSDAIDDIQIKVSGVDAAAPLGEGGVINIATASGTNVIHGAVTSAIHPGRWNGSNQPGGTSSTANQRQFDVSGGGPVLKDHLWGFGAYRYSRVATGISRTAQQLATLRALDPGFAPFDSVNRSNFLFAKLTAQPSSRQRLSGFYQRDVNPSIVAVAFATSPTRQATGGAVGSAGLSSIWSNRLTTQVTVAYNNKRRTQFDPGVDGPFQVVYGGTIASGGRLVGSGLIANLESPTNGYTTAPDSKTTASADATLFAGGQRSGSHELRAGLYVQDRLRGSNIVWINDGFTSEDVVLAANGTLVPFHRTIIDGTNLTSFRQRTRDYAAYVQDAWRPTRRLTVNAGVRMDRVVITDLLFHLTAQNSTEIGPRLAATYALTAEGRDVIRAHWVKVQDQPGIAAISGSTSLAQQDLYDLNLDGTFETVFTTPATYGLATNRTFDPNLHQPFVSDWGFGYSRQFEGNVSATVDFVERQFRDRPGVVETNGSYDGQRFVGYKNEAFNEIYVGTNNIWNWPVYDALSLSLTKRTKRVETIASYVRQWRHMGGTWQPNDPASFIQPDAFANDKGIGSTTSSISSPTDANSLSGTQMTQRASGGAQWQDHTARAGLLYSGPWKLLVGANYTFQSGIWSGPIVTRLAAPDPAFGPTTVTLSNGRVVSNPLATTIRFAFPNRGDGQLTTPHLHTLNLRVGRQFAFGRLKVDGDLDLYNLTNNGADMSFEINANQQYSTTYGTTTFRQLPRSGQFVIHVAF